MYMISKNPIYCIPIIFFRAAIYAYWPYWLHERFHAQCTPWSMETPNYISIWHLRYILFSSELRYNYEDNLKCIASGVLVGLASRILNLSNTFLRYPFLDKHNLLALLSWWISIPRIFLASPRSFISNSLLNKDYNFIISCLLFAINII